MVFLLEFAALTGLYVTVFSLLVGVKKWIRAAMRGSPLFLEAVLGALRKLFSGTHGARHRRLEYLLAMTLLTGAIAVNHPGQPVIIAAARETFSSVSRSEAGREAAKVWSFIRFGGYPPKASASAPASEHPPTWFWLYAFFLYFLGTLFVLIIEFFDDVLRPAAEKIWNQMKAWREDHERREEGKRKEREQAAAAATAATAAAQAQQGQGRRKGQKGGRPTPPTPTTPPAPPATPQRHWFFDEVGWMAIVGLVMDVAFDVGRRYLATRRAVQ